MEGPDGNDGSLRPNQLLALSLRHSPVDAVYRQAIFEQVTQHLLTPFGLRTLAPDDANFRGDMPAHDEEQQLVLHQGAVWPWLLGPYIEVMLTLEQVEATDLRGIDSDFPQEYQWRRGITLLEPLRKQLTAGMLGTIGSVFSGSFPHQAGNDVASALSVGELLRIYQRLTQLRVARPIALVSSRSER